MHQSSIHHMTSFRERYLEAFRDRPLQIYDLGSLDVNGSYREIFDRGPWSYFGIDLAPGKNVDIVLKNPYDWKPVKTESVDVLVSGQVFEHVEFFWITVLEISRVLKPGGLCCIIAPSGGYEHRYPVDCWRFFPDGLRVIGRFARLVVLESKVEWEPDPRFSDSSNLWKDGVLVCRKPERKFFRDIAFKIWLCLARKLLTVGLS